ncbi:ParA family protein, partial [Magnetococcales bacterium HHB-1]
SHQVASEVQEHLGNIVFKTRIPRNSSISEASSFGKPVLWYDTLSSASYAFLNLAMEITKKI